MTVTILHVEQPSRSYHTVSFATCNDCLLFLSTIIAVVPPYKSTTLNTPTFSATCLSSGFVTQSGKVQVPDSWNCISFRIPSLASVIPWHIRHGACVRSLPLNQTCCHHCTPDGSAVSSFCRLATRQDIRPVHSPNRWTQALSHHG